MQATLVINDIKPPVTRATGAADAAIPAISQ
jgi:hypothetical protein